MARRGHASAASRRDHPVGRPERPLPRLRLPRRHPVRVPEAVGEAPGRAHPVRPRRATRGRIRTPANRSQARSRCPKTRWRRTASMRSRSSRSIRSTTSGIARARRTSRWSARRSLTCANWGGQGIHPRGNFNGYTETPDDTPKWLEAHGDSHWSLFSSGYGVALQKRFFDHFLKGVDNGWDKAAARAAQHPPSRRALRAAPRERMAARAHAVDEALPRSRTTWCSRTRRAAGALGRVRGARRRRHVPHAAAREGHRDHRARWWRGSSSRRRPRTPTSS